MQFQGISDGAGAVILASEKAVRDLGLKPLARLVGYSVVGVEPTIMGIGPAPAIEKLLKIAGQKLSDIDLVEVMLSRNCDYHVEQELVLETFLPQYFPVVLVKATFNITTNTNTVSGKDVPMNTIRHCIAAHIIDLCPRWWSVVSLMHQLLHTQLKKNPHYTFNRRLGGYQNRYECVREEKVPFVLLRIKP